uniref:hypothetical protein n=1 Tax=Cupriavidus taiwanensis TaxID=164546 RepID=UPI0011C083A5|nr:hypothetical protein [Cupriavidus taiwanensis]
MMSDAMAKYGKCFISAPLGLDLGELPDLLAERGIEWEWAKESSEQIAGAATAIKAADFFIGVLTSSRGDLRVLFEAGVASGLSKPILLIVADSVSLSLEYALFSIAKVSLNNRRALAFNLDAFRRAPHKDIFSRETSRRSAETTSRGKLPQISDLKSVSPRFESALERRIYDVVVASGGTAQAQPEGGGGVGVQYRPDLLVWLGHQEPELLDPAVVEVKGGRIDDRGVSRIEARLLSFMNATGVRTGFVVSSEEPPGRSHPLSANIFWLGIAEFEHLVISSSLGNYVRNMRNRIVHGAR